MTRKQTKMVLLLGAAILSAPLCAAPPVSSQSQSGILSFPPDFFAESSPADAYDMVRRLPGFTLIEGDEDVRGYAGATGNVLFDGKLPSSKQEGLQELLKRTPADSVERIELIRGGAPGIDMGGHSIVANIIRKRTVTKQAAVETGVVVAEDRVIHPTISIEASRQSGNRRLQGALALLTEIDEEAGDGLIEEIGADGALEGRSERDNWEVERTLSASAEYETVFAGGELNANGGFRREKSRADTKVVALDDDGENETSRERERLTSLEAGARYRRPLGEGLRVEVLGLQRLGRLRAFETAEEDDENERFEESTNTSETIGRISFRRERRNLAIDASLEGAFNSLDSDAELQENGEPVELPGSDAHVTERRGEASIGATWEANRRTIVEGAMRVETSTIRSGNEVQSKQSFLFFKPRLGATFTLGKSDQLRLNIQRNVAQLDFGDFVASASLDRDVVSAGALELIPPQTWSFSAAYEHRFWDDGAISLSLEHQKIDDVLDRVIVITDDEIFDAVGNIGTGSRQIAKLELSAPLDRLGLKGVQFKSSIVALRSEVTDPVTGEKRRISGDAPWEGEIGISQDLLDGALTWGADLELGESEREYRFDEVSRTREGMLLTAFVEYRPAKDWRLRFEAANITGRRLVEIRDRYDGPRSSLPLDEVERRTTETGPIFQVTARKSFGSGSD